MLPKARLGGRPRNLEIRKVINAILYLMVGGNQWRMLPKGYKHPTTECIDSQSVIATLVAGLRGCDSGKDVKGTSAIFWIPFYIN